MKYISGMFLVVLFLVGCAPARHFSLPVTRKSAVTGRDFYRQVVSSGWQQRDSVAVRLILDGDLPAFYKKFVRIHTSLTDSTGKTIRAYYFVAPDYLGVGTSANWARVPLTAMAAQKVADSLGCFLPTAKMVDDIYEQAVVKLEPVPMYAFRDSSVTMWQHHLIIEGQRNGRKGLIAGIKKDLVLSGRVTRAGKPNREAIYGWHQLNGQPIQPLYTGHINWWVDYSHGIRLVYRTIWVDGRPMDYIDVLKDPVLHRLLCNEDDCDFYRYAY